MQSAITFLDLNGDTTIVWDDDSEEKVLSLIEEKIKEGYVFYIVKQVPLTSITRRARTKDMKAIREAGSVILKDAALEKLFQAGAIGSARRTGTIDTVKKASNANEVVGNQTVAVRPQRGG